MITSFAELLTKRVIMADGQRTRISKGWTNLTAPKQLDICETLEAVTGANPRLFCGCGGDTYLDCVYRALEARRK